MKISDNFFSSLHPLVIGEPFRAEDIQIEELHNTGNFSSGVGSMF